MFKYCATGVVVPDNKWSSYRSGLIKTILRVGNCRICDNTNSQRQNGHREIRTFSLAPAHFLCACICAPVPSQTLHDWPLRRKAGFVNLHAVRSQPFADHTSPMIDGPSDFEALPLPWFNSPDEIGPTSLDPETGDPFALDGWEAEIEAPAPSNDPSVREVAKAAQADMAKHAPIDTWPDWGDLSAYLPDNASFLPAIDDPEAHALLRRLFLRDLREGSVPNDEVIEVSRAAEGAQDEARAEVYRSVLADMGCQVDERWERADAFEDSTVHVDPAETPEEEDALTDALAHIGELTSTRHDPFYIYQREAQSHRPRCHTNCKSGSSTCASAVSFSTNRVATCAATCSAISSPLAMPR